MNPKTDSRHCGPCTTIRLLGSAGEERIEDSFGTILGRCLVRGVQRSTNSVPLRVLVSSLLACAVLTSLATPLLSGAIAAPLKGNGSARMRWQPLFTPAVPQETGQRSGELLVRFRAGTGQQSKDNVLASHGLRAKKQLRGESGVQKLEILEGQSPETVAQLLRLQPEVEFAEPNFIIKKDQLLTTDPQFAEQWGLRNTGQNGGQFGSDINVTSAWQTTTGSQSTVIAVIDSGIDFTHPDLHDNEWTNPSPGAESDLNGWDYVTDGNLIIDEQGHGTAVAGIIAAHGNNAIGITGVMWRASLMSLRVLDNTGSGDVANAVEAIDYAVAHRAQVINLSWGTTGNSLILKDAIERAIRRGVVVVCSADKQRAGYRQVSVLSGGFWGKRFGCRGVDGQFRSACELVRLWPTERHRGSARKQYPDDEDGGRLLVRNGHVSISALSERRCRFT